jgi:hypothetical protein
VGLLDDLFGLGRATEEEKHDWAQSSAKAGELATCVGGGEGTSRGTMTTEHSSRCQAVRLGPGGTGSDDPRSRQPVRATRVRLRLLGRRAQG